MKKQLLLALIILVFSFTIKAQINLEKYFNPMRLTGVDFYEFDDVNFKWDMQPALQVLINEGINYLKEEDIPASLILFDSAIHINPNLWMVYYYRGVAYQQLYGLDKAEKDLKKCIRLKGETPQVHVKLGDVYLMMRNVEKAEYEYKQSVSIDKGFTKGYYKLGLINLYLGLNKKAEQYFEKCLERDSTFSNAYVILGVMEMRGKKVNNRQQYYFNKAVESDDQNALAYFWRGFTYAEDKKYDECLINFNKAADLDPNNKLYRIVRGALHFELKNYEAAFTDLKKYILSDKVDENRYTYTKESDEQKTIDKRIDLQFAINYMSRNSYDLPEAALNLVHKACCHIFMNNYKEAQVSLREAQSIEESSSICFLRALALEYLNNFDSAYVYYSKAIALDPDIYDAYKKRAIFRYELKDWKGAYADLTQMVRIQPNSPSTFRLTGLIKLNFKDYYGAILAFSKFIKADSSDAEIWGARAICRENVKDYPGAISDLTKASEVAPSNIIIYQSLSKNYLLAGDTTGALVIMRKMNVKWQYDDRINFALSETYLNLKQYDSASYYLTPVLETTKNNPFRKPAYSEALHIEAKIHFKKGEVDESLKILNKSLKTDPNNLNARFFRVKTYLFLNQEDKAVSDLKFLKNHGFDLAADLYAKYNIL